MGYFRTTRFDNVNRRTAMIGLARIPSQERLIHLTRTRTGSAGTGVTSPMTTLISLLRSIRSSQPHIVGIDGAPGSGKTTFAQHLSKELKCESLHLDSYLVKGQGSFVPSIRYDDLRAAIALMKGPFILEGLCILAVLERLSLRPDFLVYVEPESRFQSAKTSALLQGEFRDYFEKYSPRAKAHAVISLEHLYMSSSHDVDIAFIRSKTIVSVVLALGGLLQTVAGGLLLNAGLNNQGTATLKIMGAEVSASGLGGIVLCTSVMWAYFAYLARPKFSSRSETRNTVNADGSSESYEFTSSTQMEARPDAVDQEAGSTTHARTRSD